MKQKRWLLWIVFAGLAVRLGLWLYFRANVFQLVTMRLPDDALYYFAIARNLAHGHGISFDSIHPTNGMHPLWLFILSPIFLLHLTQWGSIHAALLLQSILDAFIVWLIGGAVYVTLPNARASNRQTGAALAAGLYAFSPLILLRGINGMETTLAALLFVIWFRSYRTAAATARWAPWIVLGIVTGLLLLARTDSFVVLVPVSLVLIVTKWSEHWRRMLLALLVAAAMVAPWLLWNLASFGTIMQSSGEAVPMLAMRKLHALYGSFILDRLAAEAIRNVVKPFWYVAFGLPLVTVAFAVIRRRKTLSNDERTVYLLMAGGLLLLAIHSLFRGFVRDWYIEQLLPIFIIGFSLSIAMNAGTTEVRTSGRWSLAAATIILQWFFFRDVQYRSQGELMRASIPIVRSISQHVRIASFNSGYYGYFGESQNIVNMDGVVNSRALLALEHGMLNDYLRRDSVQFILDFRGDFGGYENLFDRRLLVGFRLDSIISNPIDTSDPLVLYRRQ